MPRFFFFLIIIIIFVFIGLSVKQKNNPPLDKIISQTGTEFSQMNKNYPDSTVTFSQDFPLWWVSQDDYSIINDHSPAISLNLKCSDPNSYKETLSKIVPQISQIFLKNGFILNKTNSSNSLDDPHFYDFIQSFTKGKTDCSLIADPDCSSPGQNSDFHQKITIACTDQFAKNYQQQIPYLKDLNLKDSIIHVAKTSGDFVNLNVNYRRSGYYLIAKKENDKWVKLFSGQDVMRCEDVNKDKIPKQIMDTCTN